MRRVIPVVTAMLLRSDRLKEVTDDEDCSLRQRSRLAEYPVEGTSGLASYSGSLPGPATHGEASSAGSGGCNASSRSKLPSDPYQC